MSFGVLQGLFDMLAAQDDMTAAPDPILAPTDDLSEDVVTSFQRHGARAVTGDAVEVVANPQIADTLMDHQIDDLEASADRYCWPFDPSMDAAMNRTEQAVLQARIILFTRQDIGEELAEALADKLVRRDREGDDRRLCLECVHLSSKRCGIYTRAELKSPEVGGVLQMLQRCPAFASFQ
ncbi:hypothetical protein [Ottowia sp. VDI28]|uniref:hypothetical protein n=1 Tax=Ottowia sp. VDI28 TaxID=3133968 RepID=UPI003C2F77CF